MTTLTADDVRLEMQQLTQSYITQARSRALMRLWDCNWNLLGVLTGEIDASFEEKLNDTGQGAVTVLGDNPWVDYLLYTVAQEQDIHITVDCPPKRRWSGKASTITFRQDDKGLVYLVLNFMHDYEHVKKITCYANPLLPPELQFPKEYMWAGPSAFGIKAMIFLNLMRRFLPLWALPENIFDPSSWLANLNPSNWPIICNPGDFFGDESAWTVMATRFGNCHDVIQPVMKSAGLQLTVTRWLPGDPQPNIGFFYLTQPTLVLDVINQSGYSGPTGTVIDGLLVTITSFLDDFVSAVETTEGVTPPPQYLEPTFFGTIYTMPWVVWRNAMKTGLSGIQTWEMDIHKALASSVVAGGHSPDWVNQGVQFLLNAVLGYLGDLVGNSGLGLGIFNETFDDVVLAFNRTENLTRAATMGSNRYGEAWADGGDQGYSLSMLQAIITGMWNTRGYTSFKISVINGAPYWVGRDFDLGDRIGFEIGNSGVIYVDNCYSLKLSWSRTQDPKWDITIGNGQPKEPPFAQLGAMVSAVRGIVQTLGVTS